MRILLLASYFPKPGNPLIGTWSLDQASALLRTGAEVRVVSLTPWIPRWPGQRSSIQAYSRCPPSSDWKGLHVDYPRWPYYPVTTVERLFVSNPEPWIRCAWSVCKRRVLALAHDWKPDVIFAHHSCLNGWIAMSMSEEMGVPFFCQDHALWDISACNEHPKRKRMLRSIAARATAMIVVSQRMAADLRKVAPDARIEVLHNGADLPVFPQQCVSSATKPSVIFSAGMLIPYKAFDILLQAWALVCARFPEARLRIAGDGPERNSLMQLRHVLKIEDSVEFLGYLPQSEVHAEMAAARAFVLASWHETFGVVLLEGAAEGTPVVWASNAGAAEVLQNGVHGLVIEPHNVESAAAAIDYMLTHPEQAAIMGNAARNLVREGFTWDAVARKAIALFSAAIAPAA